MSFNIDFKFNVKKTFKHNGIEYKSLDEMPPDVRTLFEKGIKEIGDKTIEKTVLKDIGKDFISTDNSHIFVRNLVPVIIGISLAVIIYWILK